MSNRIKKWTDNKSDKDKGHVIWSGHVKRITDSSAAKELMNKTVFRNRLVGRPLTGEDRH